MRSVFAILLSFPQLFMTKLTKFCNLISKLTVREQINSISYQNQHYNQNNHNNNRKMMNSSTNAAVTATVSDNIYSVVDGVRSVVPYVHEFRTFAKGRWIGGEILSVLCNEFGAHPKSYWENAIKNGHVQVNNRVVDTTYRFRNSDLLIHRTHRHEPPVTGTITLVGETDNIVAVNKPSSMPVHPCGAYRYNCLTMILAKEPLLPSHSSLFPIHRLDRVTSGLMILAKSKAVAAEMSERIRNRTTTKIYLARVKGKFPRDVHLLQRMEMQSLLNIGEDNENENENNDHDHDHRRQKSSDSIIQPDFHSSGSKKMSRKRKYTTESIFPTPTEPSTKELLYTSSSVGYCYNEDESELFIRCPTGIINYRQGVSACLLSGKQSISSFKNLGYDEMSDTSLIECGLYTGRTHQLRLHLEFIGNPIANDPCYGGELHYGEPERRQYAIDILKDMKSRGYHLLSKPPHLDIHFDNDSGSSSSSSSSNGTLDSLDYENPIIASDNVELSTQGEDESDESYLQRTCRYCRERSTLELEKSFHCDGIWLHALRYEYNDQWKFETEWPSWTKPFQVDIKANIKTNSV